jgi:hypothetical protein
VLPVEPTPPPGVFWTYGPRAGGSPPARAHPLAGGRRAVRAPMALELRHAELALLARASRPSGGHCCVCAACGAGARACPGAARVHWTPAAASTTTMAQASAVTRPGRRRASARRRADGGVCVCVEGIGVDGSGALHGGEGDCREQAPEFDCGGHPAGLVVVHELPFRRLRTARRGRALAPLRGARGHRALRRAWGADHRRRRRRRGGGGAAGGGAEWRR